MQQRTFQQVDVFTATPYLGNALAVVLDGGGLSGEDMQRFARWTNLSETTFLLAPTNPAADYRVRIFTPGAELPFAGHPTLGSCYAWLQAGGVPRAAGPAAAQDDAVMIVQECEVGLVKIRREGEALAFAAPPLRRSAPSPALLAQVAAALGLEAGQIVAAQLLDNGPVWLGLLIDSPQTVLRLHPDHAELRRLDQKVGVAALYRGAAAAASDDEVALEVRAFAAPVGVAEDPVTGSLHASLAQWLMADGHLPQRYRAAQGQCLGRAGRVQLSRDAQGQVWVGGTSVTCIAGQVRL
jgi:PhzF family phenazine biosynthesis protein